MDLSLVYSSAASDIVGLVMDRLRQDGDLETGISPNFLIRNWPPAFKELVTKSVRDAFYAAPEFPRLTDIWDENRSGSEILFAAAPSKSSR